MYGTRCIGIGQEIAGQNYASLIHKRDTPVCVSVKRIHRGRPHPQTPTDAPFDNEVVKGLPLQLMCTLYLLIVYLWVHSG